MMAFPEALKSLKRWVCWRMVPDADSGKPRKVPVNPMTGRNAASNNPDTWGTYEQAKYVANQCHYAGIGFMFLPEDGFVGVDIDHCYDPETQVFNETARAILAKQPTSVEFSPSGTGVHLWFKGAKPKGSSKNSKSGVEMYDTMRYFTVTENTLPDALPEAAEALPDTLTWIHENFIAKKNKDRTDNIADKENEDNKENKETKKKKPKKPRGEPLQLTDEEILTRANEATNGPKFAALWQGKWEDEYEDHSSADAALCYMLAFWTAKDKVAMDRLFRQSGLMRPKWDEVHNADGRTYGQLTIDNAVDSVQDVYDLGSEGPIIECRGKYFRVKPESCCPLTNFLIQPIYMIQLEEETQAVGNFVTDSGFTRRMEFQTTELTSTQKFKNLLSKTTLNYCYFGNDQDLELLKNYIAGLDWVWKRGVKALGIYEHEGARVFVAGDDCMNAAGERIEDVLQPERFVSIKTTMLKTQPITESAFRMLAAALMYYNEPSKTVSIISWAAGCFLKTHLRQAGHKFPHLFLIGEAGSGKSTTMERVLMPIFGSDRVIAASQITQYTVMRTSASSNLVPMFMDEFKPSKMDRMKLGILLNHFRDSYDCHEGVRGGLDMKISTFELIAPMVIAGEESPDEAAIRERGIELLFSKKDLDDSVCRDTFELIPGLKEQLEDLGRSLLHQALTVTVDKAEEWYQEGFGHFDKKLPARVVNNLACCYAGLKLLETLCQKFGISWEEAFLLPFGACVCQLESAAKEYTLDGGTSNKSIVEQTFEVMARMGLDPEIDYQLSPDKQRLYIRLSQVYDKYTKYRKDYAIVGEVLPYAQFCKQLKHSKVFEECSVVRRFGSETARCFVIKYATLAAMCDVSGFENVSAEPLK